MGRLLLFSVCAALIGCEDGGGLSGPFTCSESVGCQRGFVCDTESAQCVPDTQADARPEPDQGAADAGLAVDQGAPSDDAGSVTDAGAAVDSGARPDAAPADGDGDGLVDGLDNCPEVANEDQADGDGDGLGDACDARPDHADFRLTGGFLLFGGLLVDDTHTLNGGGSSARGQSTDGVFTLKGGLAP